MPQPIFATVNGTPVHGIITHYDPYDITVEITLPFAGFTTGCHIPCLARNHKNYKGDKGKKKAIGLLTGLYLDLVTVDSKKTHLQSKMRNPAGLLDTIQPIREEQVTIRNEKASLKKSFKNKVISQKHSSPLCGHPSSSNSLSKNDIRSMIIGKAYPNQKPFAHWCFLPDQKHGSGAGDPIIDDAWRSRL